MDVDRAPHPLAVAMADLRSHSYWKTNALSLNIPKLYPYADELCKHGVHPHLIQCVHMFTTTIHQYPSTLHSVLFFINVNAELALRYHTECQPIHQNPSVLSCLYDAPSSDIMNAIVRNKDTLQWVYNPSPDMTQLHNMMWTL